QDIRYALRTMRRDPGTTLLALATLALAIGLNSSVFTLVNAISFRPLPYPHSEQLIELFTSQRSSDQAVGVSGPDARDWQARAHTLRGVAVYQEHSFSVWLGESAEITPGMRTSANLLNVVGVAPVIGRGLLP